MAGFVRRFSNFPGVDVITQIEGVSIIDLPPPGAVEGVDVGVAAIVGEFNDVGYATTVDSSGVVSTKVQPVEIFSSTDLTNKVGGFDETIGEFGVSQGNGFEALRNKRFSRLVVAPVNLASAKGVRYFRQLPVATSQSNANAVVPVVGGTVVAGREFRSGVARLRIAKRLNFTALAPIATGIGGSLRAGSSAATQSFQQGDRASQVWQVAAGGPTFVDQTSSFNDSTAANFTPFPTAEATGDYVAIGSDTTFSRVIFNAAGGTAGVGGVVTWEYWNGSAWTALSGVVDGTTGFTAGVTDGQTLSFTVPSDWATLALNSVTAYYIRARVTTVYTTNPVYDQGFLARTLWSEIIRPDGTLGAHKGDILVIGNNNAGAFQPSLEAGTYRVQTDPGAASVVLTIERLDGQNFAFTAQANVPWRLHFASDADSAPILVPGAATPGGYSASEVGGYTVPTRPITNSTGGNTDGSFTQGTVLSPALAPTAATGSSWDVLSGLGARLMPGGSGGITFTAAVQGINPVSSASIDALYLTAIDALLSEDLPARDVNIVWAARKSANIRAKLKSHVLQASAVGIGRVAVIAPALSTQTTLAAIADTDPGVGGQRDERVTYSWPGCQTFIPEAVNYRLRTADVNTTVDGVLDQSFDGFLASILSNLPPERNPGQAAPPVPSILAGVLGFQRGVTGLGLAEYIQLRDKGIAGLRMDKTTGPIIQSGVTTSLISGQKNINRRRMADFIQDSMAQRLVQFSKLPLTQELKDSEVAETVAFLDELQSPNNPPAQRISAYQVDEKSGNTPDLEAKSIFVIIVSVRTLATQDFLVLQFNVGQGVVISETLE